MKAQNKSSIAMDSINKKVLDSLGVKKQQVGKTMFRLAPQWEVFLRQLAKTSNLTRRDFLDMLASITKQAHSSGRFTLLPEVPKNGNRKSYAISEKAKETFTTLAHEYGVSRDMIVQSALAYIDNEFKKNALSPAQKIEYATTLKNACEEMLDIFESKSVREARNKLCATGDPHFSDCEGKLAYIEQLNEFGRHLDNYIKEKRDEAHKACD